MCELLDARVFLHADQTDVWMSRQSKKLCQRCGAADVHVPIWIALPRDGDLKSVGADALAPNIGLFGLRVEVRRFRDRRKGTEHSRDAHQRNLIVEPTIWDPFSKFDGAFRGSKQSVELRRRLQG